MPVLTRRRDPEALQEAWRVYYDGVRVGTIAVRTGVPVNADQWSWCCGFHPGVETDHSDGTARTLDAACAAFRKAWRQLLPTLTAADFQAWRDQRDWTAWRYTMHARGCRLPTQSADGRSLCFCGEVITIASMVPHVYALHRPG